MQELSSDANEACDIINHMTYTTFMFNNISVKWVLRVAVAGEFIGHGVLALQGKAQWILWIQKFGISDPVLAGQFLMLVGALDILLALMVLVRPMRSVVLWMAFWGFWTALVRPLVGEPVWDFVERFANWGAPLALWMLMRKK